MNQQLDIFNFTDDKRKTGLLHRCHLYRGDQFKYTAFPSLKGMKVIGIRSSDVFNLTAEEYKSFIEVEGLKEVEP